MSSVFLSHAAEDKPIADRIQVALANAGCDVFFDELSLPPGTDYQVRIQAAISQCDLFVFLASAASLSAGRYTLTEVQLARKRWPSPAGRMLTVCIPPLEPKELPPYLQGATTLTAEGDTATEVRSAIEGMLDGLRAWRPGLGLLALLGAVVLFGIPFLWLGLSPELTLLEFISRWQVVVAIAAVFLIGMLLAGWLLGWGREGTSLTWFRRRIASRLPHSRSMLLVANFCLVLVLAWEGAFLGHVFWTRPDQEFAQALARRDFNGADGSLARLGARNSRIAEFYFVNDSERQLFFMESGSASEETCRVYLHYFDTLSRNFLPAWDRYALAQAEAACHQVLKNPGKAIALYQESSALARWLGDDESRRSTRKIAAAYLMDKNGSSGLATKEERLRTVIRLLGKDPDWTARRMVASSHILLGENADGIAILDDLLKSSSEISTIERKKLLNNIAISFAAIKQLENARLRSEEGLRLPYSGGKEDERREQVRLLATRALIALKEKQCETAKSTWETRESIKRQDPSQCGSLLAAQIMSCGGGGTDRNSILANLERGIGQTPGSLRDHSPAAIGSLIDEAGKVFSRCYLGIDFQAEGLQKALLGK